MAYDKNLLNELALHDVVFKNFDLVCKLKDEDGDTHEIKFSRLRTSGIMIDIQKKHKNYAVYDLVELEFSQNKPYLQDYIKEAMFLANQKTRELWAK